jgi:hypothetical protein
MHLKRGLGYLESLEAKHSNDLDFGGRSLSSGVDTYTCNEMKQTVLETFLAGGDKNLPRGRWHRRRDGIKAKGG